MGTLEVRQRQQTREYYRQLRDILTEEVKNSAKELQDEPPVADLVRQLDRER
jgi:hypothetical protein